MSDSLPPHDCSPPDSSVRGDSPVKNTGVSCHALLGGDPSDLGIAPSSLMSPALAVDSLPLVPPGKPLYIYRFFFN